MDFEASLGLLFTVEISKVGLNEFCIMILLQAYMGQGLEHCSLNVIGPHNLTGSGTIRRCSFVEVGVTLLEEVCHCKGGF